MTLISAQLTSFNTGIIPPVEFLMNYTFRSMLLGTTLIGAIAGSLGCFLYLRKQSLIADVSGHAAIAGVMVAFTVASLLGIDGRSMLVLTIGATISSSLAVLLVHWVEKVTHLSMDTAMVVSLALFFGAGMVMLRMITHSSLPNRGGIDKYMFGNAATLTTPDLWTISAFGGLAVAVVIFAWKPIKIITFDSVQGQLLGFPPQIYQPLLAVVTTVAVVVGMKGVGLILMIAFAIMPAAAARQWTHNLSQMVTIAGLMGGVSGAIGSYTAVNLGDVPTGPVVVIVLALVVIGSFAFAPERSLIRRSAVRRAKQKALTQKLEAEYTGEVQ